MTATWPRSDTPSISVSSAATTESVTVLEDRPRTGASASNSSKKMFDGAIQRTGRVWPILPVLRLHPETMRDAYRLYGTVVSGESPLSRVQRELLAVVVSKELDCFY